jgi:hypothetical protein
MIEGPAGKRFGKLDSMFRAQACGLLSGRGITPSPPDLFIAVPVAVILPGLFGAPTECQTNPRGQTATKIPAAI